MPPTSLLHRNSSYAGNLGGVELPAAPGSVTQFDAVGSLISPMSQQIPPTGAVPGALPRP